MSGVVADAGEYSYNPARARETNIPLSACVPAGDPASWQQHTATSGAAYWLGFAAGAVLTAPIVLPTGALLKEVRCISRQRSVVAAGSEAWLRVHVLLSQNWTIGLAGGTGTSYTLAEAQALAGTDQQTVQAALNPFAVDNSTQSCSAHYYASASATYDGFYGFRVYWDDPGPRSH